MTIEIYTLSLHDALPICPIGPVHRADVPQRKVAAKIKRPRACHHQRATVVPTRSEEHTSEVQSLSHVVCSHLPEIKNDLADALRQKSPLFDHADIHTVTT